MNVEALIKYLNKHYEPDQEVMCFGYDGRLYPLDGFESYAIPGAKLLAMPHPNRIRDKEEHRP